MEEYKACGAQLEIHPLAKGKLWNDWIIHVLKNERWRFVDEDGMRKWLAARQA